MVNGEWRRDGSQFINRIQPDYYFLNILTKIAIS